MEGCTSAQEGTVNMNRMHVSLDVIHFAIIVIALLLRKQNSHHSQVDGSINGPWKLSSSWNLFHLEERMQSSWKNYEHNRDITVTRELMKEIRINIVEMLPQIQLTNGPGLMSQHGQCGLAVFQVNSYYMMYRTTALHRIAFWAKDPCRHSSRGLSASPQPVLCILKFAKSSAILW